MSFATNNNKNNDNNNTSIPKYGLAPIIKFKSQKNTLHRSKWNTCTILPRQGGYLQYFKRQHANEHWLSILKTHLFTFIHQVSDLSTMNNEFTWLIFDIHIKSKCQENLCSKCILLHSIILVFFRVFEILFSFKF